VSAEDHDGIRLPVQAGPWPARRAERRADAGVAANARLTAANAALLLVLLVVGGMLGFLLLSQVGHWLAVRPGG
jgi:hypothetical protein